MIVCVTDGASSIFNSICSYLAEEFEAEVTNNLPENAKLIVTDILPGITNSKKIKTIFYFSSGVDGCPFLNVNPAIRRQFQLRPEIDLFCPSMYMARILFNNYKIKPTVQYPYAREDNLQVEDCIIYNIRNDIIDALENEIQENFVQSSYPVGKLYIHIPVCDEVYNHSIPLASCLGVPTVTTNRGCISEVIGPGDTLLPGSADTRQWIKEVKIAMRDRDKNSKASRDGGKKWSNLDALAAKIKQIAHKRAEKKSIVSDSKLAEIKQKAFQEKANEAMRVRKLTDPAKGKLSRKNMLNPLPSSYYQQPYTAPREGIKNVPHWFFQNAPDVVDVSIIIPMFRSSEVISQQIRNWDVAEDGITKEIIYVDDCSPDQCNEAVLRAWDQFRSQWNGLRSVYGGEFKRHIGKIINLTSNSGFATACNSGANNARGRFLVFLNADTIVTPGWLKPMIDVFHQKKNVGIVGNMQLKQDGSVDSAGSEWFWQTRTFEHIGRNVYQGKRLTHIMNITDLPQDLLEVSEREMVTGCCFAIPKNVFDEVGGFDIAYRIGYWEDSDLNMKVKEAGYDIYFQPNSIIYHKSGHSQAGRHPYMLDNAKLFYQRWVDTSKIDKYVKSIRPQ